MVKIFEQILREADKSRFLKPLWDKYSDGQETVSIDDETEITYDKLLKFVNADDILLKKALQQAKLSWNDVKTKGWSLFVVICKAYSERVKTNEKKSKDKAVFGKDNIVDICKAAGFKVVSGEDSSGMDFAFLPSLSNEKFDFIVPLNWEAAVFCDSVQCGGQGAKWCIGYEKEDGYWNDHTGDGELFIMAFNKEEFKKHESKPQDKLKFMIQLCADADSTQAWLQSDEPDETIPIGRFKKFFGHTAVDFVEAFVPAVMFDDNAYGNNNNGSFVEEDETQIPWEDSEMVDELFYLSDFYSGEYDIYDNTPAENGLTKGSYNKQTVYDKGYDHIIINLEGMEVDPAKMHIKEFEPFTSQENLRWVFDLPSFFDWLKQCGITHAAYVEFKNGKFQTINWEPEASNNTMEVQFTDCEIMKLNYTDFSKGEKHVYINDETKIRELHWPVSPDDFYSCIADSLVLENGDSSIISETYEEDEE